MENPTKNSKALVRVTFPFLIIVIASSAYAVWFGLYDIYELNWDHVMHMETMQRSSIFIKEGWIGYGGTYYKLANLILLVFSPLFSLLRVLGIETQGILSSLILTNTLFITGFFYLLFRSFKLEIKLLIPLILLLLSGPIFYWSFRAYPDVMVSGLIGIGTVLLIVYLLVNNKLAFLVFSAIFLGMALQGKPTALLILFALSPLLLISQRPLRDLAIFSVFLSLTFFIFGYPQNFEHILKQWNVLHMGESSWYMINKANFDLAWLEKFLKAYAFTALLPSLPFLFATSPSVKNIWISSSGKHLRLLFIVLFLASFGVTLFFLLRPLSVITQHYTLITLPGHCLLFLFLSTYLRSTFSYIGILVLSGLIFFGVGIGNINYIHARKIQHFDCIPHWQTAKEQFAITDLRTVYTPRGILKGSRALYKPDEIYSKLVEGGEHQLLTGRYLNRFKDTSRRLKIEADIQSRVTDPQATAKIFDFFFTLVSMEEGESVRIDNLEIELIQDNKKCGIKRFEFKQLITAVPLT